VSLDKRKIKILKAIISSYIDNAEAVGSRTISKKYELGVSPATIRNEMSDLEEMGFWFNLTLHQEEYRQTKHIDTM